MNEVVETKDEVVSVGTAKLDPCGVVDLGDAITETKQAYPVPIVQDSQYGFGWSG